MKILVYWHKPLSLSVLPDPPYFSPLPLGILRIRKVAMGSKCSVPMGNQSPQTLM